MIRPMMGHRKQPKKFDLPLRHYNPEEEEKRRRRIQIKTKSSARKRARSQNTRILIYAFGLAAVIYIIAIL